MEKVKAFLSTYKIYSTVNPPPVVVQIGIVKASARQFSNYQASFRATAFGVGVPLLFSAPTPSPSVS